MSSRYINENIKRKLYAESMGYCMNPNCRCELFKDVGGEITEKAHIDPYCKTADNSFENLVLLCPNCHTNFDKNNAFTQEEVLGWKKKRQDELRKFFEKKFATFEELKKAVVPLLMDNKMIYENYYQNNKALWDKFEPFILINNRKLKQIFAANLNLIQWSQDDCYSNLKCIQVFMKHVDEFEITRGDQDKNREILFPAKINSIFGIEPVEDSFMPSVEALELLIEKLKEQGRFIGIQMGLARPYILMSENDEIEKVFLDDTPRIRQIYYNYKCFEKAKVRLKSLNFALKYIRNKNVSFKFYYDENLREICVNDQIKMIFIYEYCLGKARLMEMMPEENSVIVNLHNWNGESCISKEAYESAERMNVKLLTMDAFYEYIRQIK